MKKDTYYNPWVAYLREREEFQVKVELTVEALNDLMVLMMKVAVAVTVFYHVNDFFGG